MPSRRAFLASLPALTLLPEVAAEPRIVVPVHPSLTDNDPWWTNSFSPMRVYAQTDDDLEVGDRCVTVIRPDGNYAVRKWQQPEDIVLGYAIWKARRGEIALVDVPLKISA